MPRRAPKPCARPGCRKYASDRGYCADHALLKPVVQVVRRSSAASRGYDGKWRRERAAYLREYPLCVRHLALQQAVAATVVDHIIPHRGDLKLFWSRRNWQSLCKPCHDRKTAMEDGGFGNAGRVQSTEARGGDPS